MTLPHFGKIVPLQGDLLRLAGYLLSRDPERIVPDRDEERIAIMRSGRQTLIERTGRDFGYDLKKWMRFLKTDPECRGEFKHPYAYRTTVKWIRQAMDDLDRQRLVSMIEESDQDPGPRPSRPR